MLFEVILDGADGFQAAAAELMLGHSAMQLKHAELHQEDADVVNAQLLIAHVPALPFAQRAGGQGRFGDVSHLQTIAHSESEEQ